MTFKKNGYILPVVLLIIVFLSLSTVFFVRQTAQSSTLSTYDDAMTLAKIDAENALALATYQFTDLLASIGRVDPSQAESRLSNALNNMNWSTPEENATITATIRPDSIVKQTDSTGQVRSFSAIVDVQSTGEVHGQKAKRIESYRVSTIANIFQFSIYTPGTLELNGAPYIKGDLYVGENLVTRNCAKYIYSGNRTQFTAFPYVNGMFAYGKKDATFIINQSKSNSCQGKDTSISTDRLNEGFSENGTPQLIRPKGIRYTTIDVRALYDQWNNIEGNYPQFCSEKDWRGRCIESVLKNDSITFLPSDPLSPGITVDKVNLKNSNVNIYGDLVVKGDMTLENTTLTLLDRNGKPSSQGKIIVRGNLSLTNSEINGVVYVGGTAQLEGDIRTNSTLYVVGSVTMEGMTNSKKGSTLVIVADGDIQVANNNLYVDTPQTVPAFLYSNRTLSIYGVGSHLKIVGGIYGSNIMLSAVKGNTKKNCSWLSCSLTFDSGQLSLPPERARLQVVFSEDMIQNPPDGIYQPGELTSKRIDSRWE